MKTCPACGTRMEDTQNLCPACGADYVEAVVNDITGGGADAQMMLAGRYFFFGREGSVYPMNLASPAFHAPEPSHLPLGELMDSYLKLRDHLLKRKLPDNI